jgi:hypothetical protein
VGSEMCIRDREKEDANKYVDRYDESRIHFESI